MVHAAQVRETAEPTCCEAEPDFCEQELSWFHLGEERSESPTSSAQDWDHPVVRHSVLSVWMKPVAIATGVLGLCALLLQLS